MVRTLTAGQLAQGHDVHVAAVLDRPRPSRHTFLDALDRNGVATTVLTVSGRAYARERAAVSALCGQWRPNVVHTHGYRPDVVDAGAARRAGVPVVTTVHGFTGAGWRGRLYEWLQRRAFRSFDAVVVVSRPLADRLAADGVSPQRLHLIRNAFAAEGCADRTEARRALGLGGDGFVAGWVGRVSREKAADVFLDALAILDGSIGAAIIGDGRERAALAARTGDRLGDRVQWLGQVAGAARLISAFNVLVLSSRTEGTPIVLFEAMAAGVPVVATAVGGVPDVVSPAEALLVPSEDPAALARAIATVRDDPAAARRRADAARARLAADFAPEAWVERYTAVYDAIRR